MLSLPSLSLILALTVTQSAHGFTSQPAPGLSLAHSGSPLTPRSKFDLSPRTRLQVLGFASPDFQRDSILRQIEKKEAEINKQREAALARLTKAEQSLQEIQTT